jgi:hypothetical protein
MRAKILELNVPNKNGRIYTTEAVQAAIEQTKGRDIFGSIGYPDDFNGTVNLERVSHRAVNIRIEDGDVFADIKIMNTPNGKILKQLEGADVPLHFRPAGFANIAADGTVSDYQIISIDVVHDPA